MDTTAVIAQLREEFPGKTIVCLPEDNPTEIIVELDRNGVEDCSVAVAVIDRSAPHYHRMLTETYEVQEGVLYLQVEGMLHVLNPGDTFTIHPGQVHWAEGKATRIIVTCTPPWRPDDHILAE